MEHRKTYEAGRRPATLKQRKQRVLAWKLRQVTGMLANLYNLGHADVELSIIAQELKASLERAEKLLRHRLANLT